MEKKFILISLDDEKSKKLADILGNKTCKKIIDFLSDQKEASEKDIADALKMPLNTVEYNLKKLVNSDLIEKTKNFFWSSRGKKIPTYKISNKSIIISPSRSTYSKLRSIIPVVLIAGVVAALIGFMTKSNELSQTSKDFALQAQASTGANEIVSNSNLLFSQPSPVWIWFFAGVVFTLILFVLLNWRKL
ncbi:MAG: helix-turn-helix domain-containing protein [Nanoarchaeota archaeon]|nr:helix-turn-helix domain-containing protein [Nanoarchaeota archaeon]